jgi:hypothetical protein
MMFKEWFAMNRSRAAELARSFPVTPSAVHQWSHNGVPLDRMQGVEAFTQRAVTVAEMLAEYAQRRRERKDAP